MLLQTCNVEDRLESHSKMADFEGIILLHTLRYHTNSPPIFLIKDGVVKSVQRWSLQDSVIITNIG